ncbi:hypothetical protein Q9295_01145 [Xinfangfangia sp. CPCC 101601]|uniref:Uncharacterized protein n=1 Tax=Pseudogemmobacter lacusdianii TaxID=3069608 RepID=A0ABU0VTA4_9RHOB|nr:hypothetical protein [Xinfangfangia sp. CPCC 101601]MDQ2064966.1 hypothetical protein [Xinfangfangia sp. CPCC 101601]
MFKAAKKHWLFGFGAILSAAYITALIAFTGLYKPERLNALQAMPLNELGDFLAGAFGPMAIFWVVLGFIQQGAELRNSVATLEIQARELANSAEQHRALAQVSREQLDYERAINETEHAERKKRREPVFSATLTQVGASSLSHGNYEFTVTNGGGEAHNLTYTLLSDGNALSSGKTAYAGRGWISQKHVLSLPFNSRNAFTAAVSFTDEDGESRRVNVPTIKPF